MHLASIAMTPVKCTGLHLLNATRVERHGIPGDRDFLLVDGNGALVSPSKHAPFLPLHISADPSSGHMTALLPNGERVTEALNLGAVEPLDYMGMRQINVRPVLGGWNRFLSDFAQREVRLMRCETPGQGIDVKPITLMTTGSLHALGVRLGTQVDARRFRANLVIDAETHAEDGWEGRSLAVGTVVLKVLGSVPRCVVTQLNPDTGINDSRTVAALLEYRPRVGIPDGLMPGYRMPGFAMYADVVQPGEIAIGDSVQLI